MIRLLSAALVLCLLVSTVMAQTSVESPKLNGYGAFNGIAGEGSKLNGYGVLHGIQAETAKLNAYGVFTTCVAVPKLIGYGVLESAENILRDLLPIPKPAYGQWWPFVAGAAGAAGPCR